MSSQHTAGRGFLSGRMTIRGCGVRSHDMGVFVRVWCKITWHGSVSKGVVYDHMTWEHDMGVLVRVWCKIT